MFVILDWSARARIVVVEVTGVMWIDPTLFGTGKGVELLRIRDGFLLGSIFGSIVFADYMSPRTSVEVRLIHTIEVVECHLIVEVFIVQVDQSFSQHLCPNSVTKFGWET